MAGSQRYIRYILLAFIVAATVFFFTSSTARYQTADQLQKTAELLKGQGSIYGGSQSQAQHSLSVDAAKADATTTAASSEQTSSSSDTSPNPDYGSKTHLAGETAPGERMNATFVTLARNSDVWEIARSIRQVEDRFNRKYHYDWVFLNDAEFDETFISVTTALVSGNTRYGKIDSYHWGFPDFIDQEKAAAVREDMHERKIIYGDSVSYRHMCRYESGFFFRHPLMMNYEWYWRVEPSIELFCDINYDPFEFMVKNKKKYSFVLSLYEYVDTIPTLWDSTKKWIKNNAQHIADNNGMEWISDDGGETYNNCHFWSNFEIGSLKWLRSEQYISYFEHLDKEGGFFYERWGDAPVHSIAAALMLRKEEIHFFNDIGYYHVPFMHCPTGAEYRMEHKCHCNPSDNFDWNGYSCTKRFYEMQKMTLPEGYEKEQ
ncbi:glycosyltransferase family 15 protein [Baudoinia panamericana UAMH 10762]|uniref:Glycosyltransferase family 15 protein n=1 Tax=Baudoinia panamericana (strain UAMH 10762) TaxID=717646 RepID=M2MJN8_BAUPA|nr:glycosyltransferase family 15 protein [Baudoinia panamericana UAMH 10762]EMC91518.1 glycosyltransferase family 15 protein [Baudoinia panamericana UAMH 10762]